MKRFFRFILVLFVLSSKHVYAQTPTDWTSKGLGFLPDQTERPSNFAALYATGEVQFDQLVPAGIGSAQLYIDTSNGSLKGGPADVGSSCVVMVELLGQHSRLMQRATLVFGAVHGWNYGDAYQREKRGHIWGDWKKVTGIQRLYSKEGRIGIGTSVPTTSLHIHQGNFRLSGASHLNQENYARFEIDTQESFGHYPMRIRNDQYGVLMDVSGEGLVRARTGFKTKHFLVKSANNTDGESPGIVHADHVGDDFYYDREYINHYGFGFHGYQDGTTEFVEPHNAYMSGHFGLDFFTAGNHRMRISQNGEVSIGTPNRQKGFLLAVNGKVRAKEIVVNTGWSDFVFEKDYDLPSLSEVEAYIKAKGHLEHIPSAGEVEKNGVDLGAMDAKLLQKIEELTLYAIEQEKEIKALRSEVEKVDRLETELEALKEVVRGMAKSNIPKAKER
ncbi:hypothetical protein FUAX_52750 (plasmid) [Fulvitalea axinellae]|uniref:Uncharacterized protein n=1 Tax=Fulvitalea axinellae TaxID=1182444 RepID=A0AAU9CY26_9BACT|nr:hypothetical protein FUAX_52750 [Fulvitalea axinellae]